MAPPPYLHAERIKAILDVATKQMDKTSSSESVLLVEILEFLDQICSGRGENMDLVKLGAILDDIEFFYI